jgi:hypothetical protein
MMVAGNPHMSPARSWTARLNNIMRGSNSNKNLFGRGANGQRGHEDQSN